jgi:AmmeMemoRadiSam system protein B
MAVMSPIQASVRRPAVAGMFYPSDPVELRATVEQHLARPAPSTSATSAARPKALIVPHAGYIYSGSVAASAYAHLASRRSVIRRVVLIGPSHRVYLNGIAVPQVDAFTTPLGEIPIDHDARTESLAQAGVIASDTPHELEHSLEVQLPFLQTLLDDFVLLPLVAGAAQPALVAATLARAWGGEETIVLVSSDLSHYHSYAEAQRLDSRTATAIIERRSDLEGENACGAVPINGLTWLARDRNFDIEEIARLNSGDTSGDRARVVGYGAFALHEAHA